MKTPLYLALAGGILLTGCGESSDKSKPAQHTNAATTGSSPLTAPADYLGAIGKAQQSALKTVDTARVNQAIQMFNVEQGRNPKNLSELVEQKYLPGIPEVPHGMKLQYDAENGRVKVVPQ